MARKIVFTFFLFFIVAHALAKEGMWPPFLFEQIQKDLKASGLKLKISDLYSEEKSSLKDAIVIFGSGCTGEIISKEGLVLTNHHCGYGSVQGLSSTTNNYLLNGFFAKSKQEEIPCAGLKVTFIKSYTDVTEDVLRNTSTLRGESKEKQIKDNIELILAAFRKDTLYDYQVSDFYQGNQYFLIRREVFKDVRLVAFPPNGIGKFGGDTDNWAWPRHTGDFGMFRIYVNKNNQAAEYSPDNVPFNPPKYLTINVDGVKEGEFTMVYGFPGRTQEYISSAQMNNIIQTVDPTSISCREARLTIWNAAMANSKEDFVKYASKQARVANYWKKWKGELLGLKINDGLDKKLAKEKELRNWASSHNSSAAMLDSLEKIYANNNDLINAYYFYREALNAIEITEVTDKLGALETVIAQKGNVDSTVEAIKNFCVGFYKNYNPNIDKETSKALLRLYKVKAPKNYQISFVANVDDVSTAVDNSFMMTKLTDMHSLDSLLNIVKTENSFDVIADDEMYIIGSEIQKYFKERLQNQMKSVTSKVNDWNGELMKLYFDAYKDQKLFPDANSTLRLTYGKIQGVCPQDGMCYQYQTTLTGVVSKADEAVEEFDAPKKLLDLANVKAKDKYYMNGTVPLAFLSSNHTTGGNSGSPVLNKKGELIGLNFDRIWEGTMSDLYFDTNICRNISVNIRYVLFIVDDFGGAGWLLNEMKIVGKGF